MPTGLFRLAQNRTPFQGQPWMLQACRLWPPGRWRTQHPLRLLAILDKGESAAAYQRIARRLQRRAWNCDT